MLRGQQRRCSRSDEQAGPLFCCSLAALACTRTEFGRCCATETRIRGRAPCVGEGAEFCFGVGRLWFAEFCLGSHLFLHLKSEESCQIGLPSFRVSSVFFTCLVLLLLLLELHHIDKDAAFGMLCERNCCYVLGYASHFKVFHILRPTSGVWEG